MSERRRRRGAELEGSRSRAAGARSCKNVSLEIPPGEVTALLGPNGAGKSSLVLAVAGVLPAEPARSSSATRELAGRRPEKIRAAGVAVVPEGRRLLPDLTVEDNIQVATYALSGSGARERPRVRALELFPELEARLDAARARSRAASSRWSCSPRRSSRSRSSS